MYYSHFGLNQPPFKITPNTEIFFTGSNRGAVLDALMYAVTSGEGIVKVVGEVGSGKTMLCRMLQSQLPETVECIYLANPSVAPEDILHAIAFELSLDLPQQSDKLHVMQALQTYLLERHAEGKQVVIFVEEAQGMPLATLEEIRLLSNLETKHDKLLQMVLFGQPELDENLNQTHIRQLRERITHSFYLTPLQAQEVGEYLIFRLRASGYYGPHLFTDKSIAQITQSAQGLIRRVNILADKALLAAYAEGVYQVTPKHVKSAIGDSEFGAKTNKAPARKGTLLAVLGTLLVAGLIAGSVWLLQTQPALQKQLSMPVDWLKSQVGLQQAAAPVSQKKTKKPETKNAAQPKQAESQKQLSATESHAVLAESVVATDSLPNDVVEAAQDTSTDESEQLAPLAEAVEPLEADTLEVEAVEASTETLQNDTQTTQTPPSLLQQRLAATEQWVSRFSDHTVTIQILGSSDSEGLQEQLDLLARLLELDNIFVYQTQLGAHPYYTVLYGSFDSRAEANAALKKLPLRIQKNRPHLRTIGGILAETNKNL